MVECRNIADPCGYLLKNANSEINICSYFCTHTSFYHPIRKIIDEFIMYTLFLELYILQSANIHDNFEMKRQAAINRQWTTIINHSLLRYNLAYFDITLWSVSFVLITTGWTKKYEKTSCFLSIVTNSLFWGLFATAHCGLDNQYRDYDLLFFSISKIRKND